MIAPTYSGDSPPLEEGDDSLASSLDVLFKVSATWQLPSDPLFFEADRAAVKALAQQSAEWLQSLTRW